MMSYKFVFKNQRYFKRHMQWLGGGGRRVSPLRAAHEHKGNLGWLACLATCLQTSSVCVHFHTCEPVFSSETYCLLFALLFIKFGKYFSKLADVITFEILFHCPHTKSIYNINHRLAEAFTSE